MRGKACFVIVLGHHLGITPAYAGKSEMRIWMTQYQKDHPRVCGEKTKKIP